VKVVYHSAAEDELVLAVRYYDGQADGLGHKFLDELQSVVDDITAFPVTWPVLYADARRHQLSHFPYGVIYRVVGDVVRVLAVSNLHQEPNYWKTRLEERGG